MIVSKTEVTVILSPKMDMRVDKFTAKSGGGGEYRRKRPGISVQFYYGISIQCLQQTEKYLYLIWFVLSIVGSLLYFLHTLLDTLRYVIQTWDKSEIACLYIVHISTFWLFLIPSSFLFAFEHFQPLKTPPFLRIFTALTAAAAALQI